MLTVIMLVYAFVLVALAGYLYTHRQHDFLTLKTVPEKLGQTLATYATVLIIAALVAAIGAFVALTWLRVTALVLGAITVGILGLNLPKYITPDQD
ncbi:MAG: hypothetical protein LKJ48_02530 [Lactobacillus sp.]|jgi:uncharacterized membrane protein|nr:hypothetical protein [Lactobacillus sp.]